MIICHLPLPNEGGLFTPPGPICRAMLMEPYQTAVVYQSIFPLTLTSRYACCFPRTTTVGKGYHNTSNPLPFRLQVLLLTRVIHILSVYHGCGYRYRKCCTCATPHPNPEVSWCSRYFHIGNTCDVRLWPTRITVTSSATTIHNGMAQALVFVFRVVV